jgi:hypothetical protein
VTRLLRLRPRSINLQLASVLQPLAFLAELPCFVWNFPKCRRTACTSLCVEIAPRRQAKCWGKADNFLVRSRVISLQASVAAYNSRRGFALQRQRPRVTIGRPKLISRMPKMLTWLLSLEGRPWPRMPTASGATRNGARPRAGAKGTTRRRRWLCRASRPGSRRRGRCAARPTTPAPRHRRRRRRRRTRSGRRHHHEGSRRMPGGSGCPGRWTCRLRPLSFPSPRSNVLILTTISRAPSPPFQQDRRQ